jgi:ferric-dicitrate binding protein FerR (iron transport regulator)
LEQKLVARKPSASKVSDWLLRIAAVFVLGLGLYVFHIKSGENLIETQLAQKELIELPDSSMVTLNELSDLRFNENTWDKERTVELKGEAFFKVAKGKKFDVQTAQGIVRVLGTQFNVQVTDDVFSVICYEGLVQVVYGDEKIELPAGNAYRVINGNAQAFTVSVVEPEWLKNMKVFENTSYKIVFKALEDHYNVRIETEGIVGDREFTGAFELDNLENALKAVTKTLNFTYERSGENLVLIRNAER